MYKFKFVDIGEGLHEGTVGEVNVKVGDVIKEGDSLFTVETDKVNSEMPSPVDGTIKKILIKEGETVHVGDVTFHIDDGSVNEEVKEVPKKVEATPVDDDANASVVGEVKVSNDIFSLDRFKKPSPKNVAKLTSKKAEVCKPKNSTPKKEFDIKNIVAKGDGENFDVVVIGAGPAGYKAATKLSKGGLKVAIVEKSKMGGTCVNIGCMPVKTFIKTQKTIKAVQHAQDLNVIADYKNVSVDLKGLQKRKNEVLNKLIGMVDMVVKGAKVKKFEGEAKFIDNHNIQVGKIILTTKVIIIATGSISAIIDKKGFAEAYKAGQVINTTTALSLEAAPADVTVIGAMDLGGPSIDINFANILNDFGLKITLLKEAPTLLTSMDSDLQTFAKDTLTKQGIDVQLGVEIKEISKDGTIKYMQDGKEKSIKSSAYIDASGRVPFDAGAVEALKLKAGSRGEIIVSDKMQTSVENIFAIGDVVGHAMLAHEAYKHGDIVSKTILGKESTYSQHMIPKMVYMLPEIATVGYTEKQLKEQGIAYKVAQFQNQYVGKALADNEIDGFAKIFVGKKYNEILGAKIVALNAIDMIAQIGLAMELESTIEEMAQTIFPHPATVEILWEAANSVIK